MYFKLAFILVICSLILFDDALAGSYYRRHGRSRRSSSRRFASQCPLSSYSLLCFALTCVSNWPHRFVVWSFKSNSLVFLCVGSRFFCEGAITHRNTMELDLNDKTTKQLGQLKTQVETKESRE